MTEALSVLQPMTREQVDLLKRTVAKGTTDDEFKLFLEVCGRRKVDPFSRLIYPVKRYDSRERCEVMALQSSIDYFRLTAERHGRYAGQVGPQWCGDDGTWTEVWLQKDPPRAARCGVLRSDFKEPLFAVALWDAYCQKTREGAPTRAWATMGSLMLGKCAEALAIRRAFPEDLAGLYTADEMEQSENGRPAAIEAHVVTAGDRPSPFTTREQAEVDAFASGPVASSPAPERRIVLGIPITCGKTWEQAKDVTVATLNPKSKYAHLTLAELIDEDKDDGRIEYLEEAIHKVQDGWNRMTPKQKAEGLRIPGQLALIAYDEFQARRSASPIMDTEETK